MISRPMITDLIVSSASNKFIIIGYSQIVVNKTNYIYTFFAFRLGKDHNRHVTSRLNRISYRRIY